MSVAFVGAGRRALVAARMLHTSGSGHAVGFWNRSPEPAQQAAAEFGVSHFASVSEMVERQRPDLVAVMTHPAARVDVVDAAIRGGATNLLVEKPLALNATDLAEIERLAGDRFVVVNTQYQWMAHWQRFLTFLGEGRLGEIRHIRASVGVDILEQGPHALSLAMAVADRVGLPRPSWVVAGGAGGHDFGGTAVPDDSVSLFDLGTARLTLTAGPCSPGVPGETVRAFQQQTEIVGSRGRVWVSLNQGAELWTPEGMTTEVTDWSRDDEVSQTGLFADIARALADPGRQTDFPTRLSAAAGQARMLFGAMDAIHTGAKVSLAPTG